MFPMFPPMSKLSPRLLAIFVACVASDMMVAPAQAGMPSLRLTDVARMRVESMSFFLMLVLVSAAVIMALWNWLRRDFVRLPRLTYLRSLGVVTLWGLLFILVLTMISGARELLTPGAWEPKGVTYRLTETERTGRMEALRSALWAYAAQHGGALPPSDSTPEISAGTWETPDPSRIRYVYLPGAEADVDDVPVAFEPPAFPSPRLVLSSDGKVRPMHDADLRALLAGRGTR
jgi:hypothetical protein